jgi:protein FRA10AC1
VVTGKGQFTCGAKRCSIGDGLVSYEVLFAYEEAGEAKSALVKLRVCPECAYKLNYRRAKALRRVEKLAARNEAREHKRRRADAGAVFARPRHGDADAEDDADDAPEAAALPEAAAAVAAQTDAEYWGAAAAPAATEPSREDEYDAYFSGMFA